MSRSGPSEADDDGWEDPVRTAPWGALVEQIARATGESPATIVRILNGLVSAVSAAVAKGEKVTITGFLSFEQVATAARTGRNPQTGEEIKIAAGKRVKVTVGSKLNGQVDASTQARVRTRGRRAGA